MRVQTVAPGAVGLMFFYPADQPVPMADKVTVWKFNPDAGEQLNITVHYQAVHENDTVSDR